MKLFLFSHWKPLIGVVILIVLLAFSFQMITGETPLGNALKSILPQRETVIAYVNGEPILLNQLELMKTVIQTNDPDLVDTQAYQQSMQAIIRQKALAQEARRRGFTATYDEAKKYWEQVQILAKQESDIMELMKAQEKAFPGSKADLEAKIITVYQESISVGKMVEALRLEVPAPLDDEIWLALSEAPISNVLILIPIEFKSSNQAQEVLQELQYLLKNEGLQAMEEKLTSIAQQQALPNSHAFFHQEFTYKEINELPDYAKSAVQLPENSLGIYERLDGTAVIFLVLKSEYFSKEQSFDLTRERLWREKQDSYLIDFENNLINNANIKIINDNLPIKAKEAFGN